jgi:glycosyltransferase involved in cell wall biosynthesis
MAPIHVLILNTQASLRADVSVHVSLARALDRRHVRVSVATNRFEAPGASARAAFAAIPDLRLSSLDLGRPVSSQRGIARWKAILNNLRSATTLVPLAQWCRRHGVNIVHVTERPRDAVFGLALARLAGCACVIHAHTTFYPHARSMSASVSDWVLGHADAVVGVSRFTADSYWQHGVVARERVFAVNNAVDCATLAAEPEPDARMRMRQRFDLPSAAPVVGSVGRLMRGKDQATLLEAFAAVRERIPDARLVLAGSAADIAPDGRGDYRDYLIRRADELGIDESVVFTGFLAHEEMPALYAALDVFAHPCVEEPFGLVVVEAMARQVPVVAVNAGGIPAIVRPGTDGLLVQPREPQALAEAIGHLLGDEATARRLARAARERVLAAFTPHVQAQAMLEVYRAILA